MAEIMPQLIERRYKLLALDFDNTIVGVHTMGMWNGTLEELMPFVRPVFRALLQAAAATEEMNLAVVTFSGQVGLVRGVLPSRPTPRIYRPHGAPARPCYTERPTRPHAYHDRGG